jgi:hypothetical protein
MSALTKKDYGVILHYYGVETKGLKLQDLRNTALDILANKLCRCIKKVGDPETKSVPICKDSIFGKKGLELSRFKCKDKPKLIPKKGRKHAVTRKGKKVSIRKTRKAKR